MSEANPLSPCARDLATTLLGLWTVDETSRKIHRLQWKGFWRWPTHVAAHLPHVSFFVGLHLPQISNEIEATERSWEILYFGWRPIERLGHDRQGSISPIGQTSVWCQILIKDHWGMLIKYMPFQTECSFCTSWQSESKKDAYFWFCWHFWVHLLDHF